MSARAADLLLTNARLIDGSGSPPRERVSIEVRDGFIAAVGRNLHAPGATELDVAGLTVLPGLIDSHVHLTSVPGSAQRRDTRAQTEELRRAHLRAYLACGVTTVLDAGGPLEQLHEVRRLLTADQPAPRVFHLAPALAAPGGYVNDPGMGVVVPSVANAREVEARFEEAKGIAASGVKVFIEHGFGPTKVWPVHDADLREAIGNSARRRGLALYVHGSSEEEQALAVEMGAHALVHTGFDSEDPSNDFLKRLVASGAYVMTTLSVYDYMLTAFDRDRLDDDLILAMVPEREIATASSARAWRRLANTVVGLSSPRWLPTMLYGVISRVYLRESTIRGWLASSSRAVARFHEAGVPIVIGSDSGNWPLTPYAFHGPSSVREMELAGAAGMKPMAVIEAATRVAAEMLGMDEELGTIEPGKRADMVVLREDPLEDLRALRAVAYTISSGVARTPEQWMRR